MIKQYKYITIKPEIEPIFETEAILNNKPLYEIINNKSGDKLGNLFYYPSWRQYCFTQSAEGVVFNNDCLVNIIESINLLNDEIKNSKKEGISR